MNVGLPADFVWSTTSSAGADVAINDSTFLRNFFEKSSDDGDHEPAETRGYLLDLVQLVMSGHHPPFVVINFLNQVSALIDARFQNMLTDAVWFWGSQVQKSSRLQSSRF